MKKIDLGQGITILANLGVIAGIVFLGVELAQNNDLLAAQARYNLRVQRAETNRNGLNPFLLEASLKYREGANLTPAERAITQLQALTMLELWEWQHAEYEAGMLESDELPVGAWRLWFHGRGELAFPIRETWERRRDILSSEFVQFMEENVVNR